MGVQINGDTGNISATKADYSGNVTIGGTLTYEDVTNIDSVGLITARNGIEVGARPGVAASISVDGNMIVSGVTTIGGVINASSDIKVGSGVTVGKDGDIFATGVCTATSFAGDGSALTGIGGTDFIHSEQINNSGIVTAQSFVPTVGQFSHRNIVINGDMRIAQRGTSSTSQGYQTCDRWRIDQDSGLTEACTQSQVTLSSSDTPYASGFRHAFRITNGNQTSQDANDYIQLVQKIEAQDIDQCGWNSTSASSFITLSFWVKASIAQTFYVKIEATDASKTYTYPIAVTTSWQRLTTSIPGASGVTFNNDNGTGMRICIIPYYGTSYTTSGHSINTWITSDGANQTPDFATTWFSGNDATFDITGVQLEVGPVATPFEHRSFHDELQRCFRYFRKFGANNALPTPQQYNRFAIGYSPTGGSSARFVIQLDPPMRTNPLNANLTTGGDFNTQPGSSGASSSITVDDNSCNVNSMTILCDGLASVSTGDAISLHADGDTTTFIAISGEL